MRVVGAPGYEDFECRPIPGLPDVERIDDRGNLRAVVDDNGELHIIPVKYIRYPVCDECKEQPGQLVRTATGSLRALCFAHWQTVRHEVKVVDWIDKYGKLQHS